MPDIVQSRYNVDLPNQDQLLPSTEAFPKGPTGGNGGDEYARLIGEIDKKKSQNNITNALNIPLASGLTPALRYTDPNIGYHPFDDKLEYKYADAHPWQTAGNNILQFGARFGGAFIESIATIPLVVNAAIDKDFSKLYDNELTNGITDWLDDLNTTLPVYTSEYEENHPVLKYLNIFKPGSWAGAWGGAVNNLGYTAGAIAGALVEDVLIGVATGGIGLPAAFAANGAQIAKGIAKLSKSVAKGENIIESVAKTSLSAERGIMRVPQSERALMRLNEVGALAQGERGLIRAEGAGMFQSAGRIDDLLSTGTHSRQNAVNNMYTLKKLTDGARYQLGLLTSATAEGTFEAAEVYHRGVDELKQEFFDRYGRDAQAGEEIDTIHKTAKEASNVTMAANIALLYVSNKVNWGSLFRPTSTKMFTEGIEGWGKNIVRTTAKGKMTDVADAAGNVINKKVAYEVISKAPETRIGKILLNGERALKIGTRSINEALEEGAQFTFSEGTLDFAKAKYDPYVMQESASLLKGLKNGFDKTINTNEGWDNMVGGFIGGMLGGGIMGRIQKKMPISEQLRRQVDLLNGSNFNGVLQERFKDAIAQNVLAGRLDEAVKAKDMFAAKNAHYDMLFNWVNSGVKANGYEKRMAELEMIRDLTGKDFKDKWGLEDTQENRAKADKYLDGMRDRSEVIKKDIEKVQYITKNPFSSKDAFNYGAYETYRDELAHNLSAFKEYKGRINQMTAELKEKFPLMDIKKAVNLTSVQGMSTILQQLNKTTLDIANQLRQAEGNVELENQLIAKKDALDSIFSRIQKIVYSGITQQSTDDVTGDPTITGRTTGVQFNGKEFLGALTDLYDLHNGTSFEQNKYVQKYIAAKEAGSDIMDITQMQEDFETDDDVKADLLEKLQDVYKLSDANYNIGKYYTYLRKGVGATDFMQRIKDIAEQAAKTINSQETERYSKEREDAIREEEYIGMVTEETDEELTPTEEKVMRKAARKVVKKEKLTKEEEDIVAEKPEVFTKYVKTERIIESRLKEEGLEDDVKDPVNEAETADAMKEGEVASSPVTPENVVEPFAGIHPRNLFGLFSQDKNDAKMRTNLYTAIFKASTSVAAVANNLKATFTTDVKAYTTKFTKIPGTELWRQPFKENLNIYHNDENIGILRPVSGVFLDEAGTRSIYDMTEAEYSQLTGNQSDTYASFMESIKAQREAYNKLKESIQNSTGQVDIDTITTFFNLEINPGSRVQSTDPKADIKLGDLNSVPTGTVLVSLNDKNEPTVVNAKELNAKQLAKVNKFIKANIAQLSNTFRYALILPILGEYRKVGVVVARNAETTLAERDEFTTMLQQVASGTLSEDAANKVLTDLTNKFYITVSRENAGTYIDFRFDANFTPFVRVFNREKNVINEIAIDKAQMQGVVNYEELIKLINDSIRTQEGRESTQTGTLKALNINLKLDSLKRQIPADSAVNKLSDLNDVVKLATSSKDVFENYTIRFDPVDNIEAVQPVTPTAPVAPTPAPQPSPTTTRGIQYVQQIPKNSSYMQELRHVNGSVIVQGSLELVEKYKADNNIDELNVSYPQLGESVILPLNPEIAEITVPENVTVVPEEAPLQAEGATYVKNKTALLFLLKDIFGLTKTQAEATANVYGRVAQAWAARTGKKVEDFFKQIGFSTILPTDTTDVLNQIIGEKATANNKELARSLNKAKDLFFKNATKEEIFSQTGWERGTDNKWRKVLSTDGIKINKNNISRAGATLSSILDYPALYELYPTLGNIKIDTLPYEDKANGKVNVDRKGKMSMFINQRLLDQNDNEKLQETIIHETQHVIQALENFLFSPTNSDTFEDYFNSFSEIEARAAATLSLISDEEKQGLVIQAIENIEESDKKPSTPYTEDFKGSVIVFNAINPIQSIIKGFELTPKYDNSLFVGFTKKGKVGKALLEGISKWAKDNNLPVAARLNNTYGTIQLVNTSKQGNLFQNNAVDKAIELINKDVIKGYTAAIIKDAVANEDRALLVEYLNNIAEQANDPLSVEATVRTYGQELVDIAKEVANNPNLLYQETEDTITYDESKKEVRKVGKFTRDDDYGTGSRIKFIIKEGNKVIGEAEGIALARYAHQFNKPYSLFMNVNGQLVHVPVKYFKEVTPITKRDIGNTITWFENIVKDNKLDAISGHKSLADAFARDNFSHEIYLSSFNYDDSINYYTYLKEHLTDKHSEFLNKYPGIETFSSNNFYINLRESKSRISAEDNNLFEEYYRDLNTIEKIATFINYEKYDYVQQRKDIDNIPKEAYDKINPEQEAIYGTQNPVSTNIDMENIFSDTTFGLALDLKGREQFENIETISAEELNNFVDYKVDVNDIILNQAAKGAFDTVNKVIYALTNPDASTAIHELAHFWHGITNGANKNTNLTDAEIQQVLDWAGHTTWTRDTSEMFAKGFEVYLTEGNNTNEPALTALFDKFAKWLADLYKNIQEALGITLNDNMRGIYSAMLNSEFIKPEVKEVVVEAQAIEQAAEVVSPTEQAVEVTPTLTEEELITQRDKEIEAAEDEQQAAIDGLPLDLEEEDYNDQVALINSINNDIITSINNEYQSRIDALTEPTTEEVAEPAQPVTSSKRKKVKVTQAPAIELIASEEKENNVIEHLESEPVLTQEPETTPVQYVTYTTSSGEKAYGKILEIDGTLLTIGTSEGTEIFRSISKVNNITEAEYTKAVDGDVITYTYTDSDDNVITKTFNPKYKVGQHIVDKNGVAHQIKDIEFIPGQKTDYSTRVIENKEKVKYVNDPEIGTYVQTKTKTVNVAVKNVTDSGSNGTIVYNTVNGMRIEENTINRRIFLSGQDQVELKARYAKQIKNIEKVVSRLSQFFGGIQYEYVELPFTAPARFYKGVVQINLNNIEAISKNSNEILIHEFMHPFVKALQMSNKPLYDNLVNDLNDNYSQVIEEAKTYYKEKDYRATDLIDEALTLHLGRAVNSAFKSLNDNNRVRLLYSDLKADNVENENGKYDVKYKGIIIGETLTPGNPQVMQDIADKYAQTLNPIEKVTKDLYTKFKTWFNNIVLLIKDQKAPRTLEEFTKEANKKQQRFKFNIRTNLNSSIELEQNGTRYITVNIDPESIKDSFDTHNAITLTNLLISSDIAGNNETFTENDANELQDIFRTYFFGIHQSVNKNTFTTAKLNAKMSLEELATFIAKQYTDGDIINTIEFTPQEQDAFDEMEAYFNVGDPQLEAMRKRIVSKFELLKDTATNRLSSDTLNIQVGAAFNLNADSKDDLEFMLKYMENAAVSINMAYVKYGKLAQALKDKKGILTHAEINAMNKEFAVLRQLISYYDQFSSYHQFEDHIKADKTGKSFEYYAKAFTVQQRMREGMQDLATKLTVEWLMPYAAMHTKLMKEQGYTDEKYEITYDKLFELFKYGTGRDTNYVTFWLGANVTSRDPINAIFANTLGDMLSANNIKISLKTEDFSVAFNNFLKINNFSPNDAKKQKKYFEDNYMRKAKIKTVDTDPVTGIQTEKLTEKWALHQEYKMDEYELDLQVELAKYKNPTSSKQADEFKKKIEAWKVANKNGKIAKYANAEYAKAKVDPFFTAIETAYNDSNLRYGTNQLRFGIIPQKYEVSYTEKLKRAADLFKGDNKIDSIKEAITTKLGGLQKEEQSYNLDGTVFRNINTTLTTIKDEENIGTSLDTVIPAFIVESNNYSTLKETQYNAETLMLLLEGNTKLSIAPRTFAKEDFNSRITQPFELKLVEDRIKLLEEQEIAGDPAFDAKLLADLRVRAAKGVQSYNLWDKISKHYRPNTTNYNNDMLLGMIKDRYYGESVEEVKIGKISATKAAHYLRLYTSINNMAGNYIAGLGNITIGNTQLFIEAHGGKYLNKTDLAKAQLDYIKNIPEYVKDLQRPIKSKDTQLSIMLDAIQGEIEDEFGERVSGNIARKMFRFSSLFLFTKAGEHQIQLTNMKAMMLSRKIKTKAGEDITLYDAFTSDKEGRYSIRKDIEFNEQDLTKFMRDMHGVNRMLNGNYSTLHKTVLQRKWYGGLMLSYRKYLYPSVRARYASEHVDFERNTVEVGNLRYTAKYIVNGIGGLIKGKGLAGFTKWDNMKPHQKYAMRKTAAELGMFASLTALGIALFGSGDDEKKVELTTAQKFGALMLTRLASDLAMYHVYMPSESIRQLKNPTASLQTIVGVYGIFKQIVQNPFQVYDQDYGVHEEGDSKLKAKALKLVPLISKFQSTLNDKLGYQELLGRSIGTFVEGVTPKNNQP